MPYNGGPFGTRLGPIPWPATTRRVLAFRAVLAPKWVLALMAPDLQARP
ncbi:MAG: hypothetical protein JWR84_1934 [Caulobacter sp.]|nr:hypothetical protein [Caulobacter sp.]